MSEQSLACDAALEHALADFRRRGPDRVLLASGAAVGPRRAEAMGEGGWEVVLIREDGWMLACTRQRYEQARGIWPEGWIAVLCYARTAHRVLIRIRPACLQGRHGYNKDTGSQGGEPEPQTGECEMAERFRITRDRDQTGGRITLTVTDRLTGDFEEFPDYVGIMGAVNRWKAEQEKKIPGACIPSKLAGVGIER